VDDVLFVDVKHSFHNLCEDFQILSSCALHILRDGLISLLKKFF
jgi:hypothetical protein